VFDFTLVVLFVQGMWPLCP